MKKWRGAIMATAAAAGTGYSSGRAAALFFAQLGWASWIGVICAAAMFALICAGLCRLARHTGGQTLGDVLNRVFDGRGQAAGVLAVMTAALTAGLMILMEGRMAMLTLPVRGAFWIGAGAALLLAWGLGGRSAGMSVLALTLCGLFHLMMALDPREVYYAVEYYTVAELSGSIPAALILSALHASLNAAAAAGMTVRFAREEVSPAKFGLRCGALMLMMLLAVNGALMRGGEKLLSQPVPMALLAARWGKAGYYGCVLTMACGALCTLSAALEILFERRRGS